MEINEIDHGFDAISTLASDLHFEFVNAARENVFLLEENESLWESLSIARDYYDASRKEIAFILDICAKNGIVLPVEGHFLDINDLASGEDSQKGSYNEICECLEWFRISPAQNRAR